MNEKKLSEKKFRKSINFDLDTNKLQEYYKNISNAYEKIKNFMSKNGFEHDQGSGYVSKKPLSSADMTQLAVNIEKDLSWLRLCTRKMKNTNISKEHDMLEMLNNPKIQEQAKNERLVEIFERNLLKYAKNPKIYNQEEKVKQLKKEYNQLVKEKALDAKPLSQETQTLMDKIFNQKSNNKNKTR